MIPKCRRLPRSCPALKAKLPKHPKGEPRHWWRVINRGRLIAIMEELREASQLIVITHQKRTMEVADALYGQDRPRVGAAARRHAKLTLAGQQHKT